MAANVRVASPSCLKLESLAVDTDGFPYKPDEVKRVRPEQPTNSVEVSLSLKAVCACNHHSAMIVKWKRW